MIHGEVVLFLFMMIYLWFLIQYDYDFWWFMMIYGIFLDVHISISCPTIICMICMLCVHLGHMIRSSCQFLMWSAAKLGRSICPLHTWTKAFHEPIPVDLSRSWICRNPTIGLTRVQVRYFVSLLRHAQAHCCTGMCMFQYVSSCFIMFHPWMVHHFLPESSKKLSSHHLPHRFDI